MRILAKAIFVAVVVLGSGYAAYAIHELGGPVPVVPGADSEKLYVYITKPAPYYNKGKLCPGTGKFLASEEPTARS